MSATPDPGDEIPELESRADQAAARGDRVGARALLERVTAAAPDRLDPWLKLVAMCRAQGDLDAALAAVSGALRVDPLGFVPLLFKANLLETLGRDDEAGEAYGHVLAQKPDPVPAHFTAPLERAERLHAAWKAR